MKAIVHLVEKVSLIILLVVVNIVISVNHSYAQILSNEQIGEIQRQSILIDENSDFSDGKWELISEEFWNKKIVALGEFNHGSREVFTSRNSLIKYLHQELGFEVILFESGIGELISINQNKKELSDKQMTYGFFGGWRTEEFHNLMNYIRNHKIEIAGYDVQRTGATFEEVLASEVQKVNPDVSTHSGIEERFGNILSKLRQRVAVEEVEEEAIKLMEDYRGFAEQIKGRGEGHSTGLKLTIKTLENRRYFLQYYLNFLKDGDWSKRWAARDSAMAENIIWLSEEIYPGQKMIIIGHNFHVSRFNEKEKVMGEWLSAYFGDDYYSMGVFAEAGTYANNSGEPERMSSADTSRLDLKHIIENMSGFAGYVSTSNEGKNMFWLDEKIIVNDTFIDLYGTNEMVLSKHFDGLLLLREVTFPQR